jgi:hypothetical protein
VQSRDFGTVVRRRFQIPIFRKKAKAGFSTSQNARNPALCAIRKNNFAEKMKKPGTCVPGVALRHDHRISEMKSSVRG